MADPSSTATTTTNIDQNALKTLYNYLNQEREQKSEKNPSDHDHIIPVDCSDDDGLTTRSEDPHQITDRLLETLGVIPASKIKIDNLSTDNNSYSNLVLKNRRPLLDIKLFRTPILPPCTTLMLDEENANGSVYKDVMLNTLQGDGEMATRPLAGNLSGKLTDYTRGAVGRRNPFRAGGLDDQDKKCDISEKSLQLEAGPMQTASDIRRVLNDGAYGGLKAWLKKEEGLLKAPPGIASNIGITPQHIYSEGQIAEVLRELEMRIDDFDPNVTSIHKARSMSQVDTIQEEVCENEPGPALKEPTVSGLWADNFDDDSLFGETSSEEDDESDVMIEASDDTSLNDLPSVETELEKNEPINITNGDTFDTEVDYMLNALSEPNKSRSSLPSLKTFELVKDADDNDRKSWCNTESLDVTNFHSLVPNPAIEYSFELDDFQKQAVVRLERSESIFVAAHTSAGKTVCAEYAIALARKHCTRAIYTSPIKALSNQKYRDFKSKFKDVGLITGDIQISPDSSCLIMTTEILRSMLYRGADLVRDIEWVIFDEVHYINDSERGVVWEEVIIMLPSFVNLIFLSATTPNTIEFSDWIGRTKKRVVNVIRTNYRPVPLSHNLFAGLKLHKILEGNSPFVFTGYDSAKKALLANKNKSTEKKPPFPSRSTGARDLSWQQMGNKQNWNSLVKFLEREALQPTVVFSFSKKKCEEIANMLRSVDLNTASEKGIVHSFTIHAVSRLSPNDAVLPQVLTVCEMVKRGIGVHHGGLLPILKEMVEILFSRNLIKVLFATETFAMGVNMPARSVVFNTIRKHDGNQFRELQPGEYTQMAGRAGRRGLDKVGTVIICCFGDEPPPQMILKNMLTGTSTKLQSQFRLTYNMILNLLRVEDMSVEDMIKRSFSEFATQRALTAKDYPKLLMKGSKTLAKLDQQFEEEMSKSFHPEDIQHYFIISSQLLELSFYLHSHILSSIGGSNGGALSPGRLCLVTKARYGYVNSPAIILRPHTFIPPDLVQEAVCLVLLPVSYISGQLREVSEEIGTLNYIGTFNTRYFAIHEIRIDEVVMVSTLKEKFDPTILFKGAKTAAGIDAKNSMLNEAPSSFGKPLVKKVIDDPFAGMVARGKKHNDDIENSKSKSSKSQYPIVLSQVVKALLDAEELESTLSLPLLDLKTCTSGVRQGDNIDFRDGCEQMDNLLSDLRNHVSHLHPKLVTSYTAVERKELLRSKVTKLKHALSNEGLELFPDFLQRKRLLRTLGYIDDRDVVCLKGRVACEVNTCEELIVTELIFCGILNDLEPAEIVAALSALVFQEKNDNELDSELPESLIRCCHKMKEIATNIGVLQQECGLKIDPSDYCDSSLKFGLVHAVYEWAQGIPFRNICELTLVQEGSIVRCITRLDELCREVRNCARVVGNPTLYRKAEAASIAIKRDIVFASSLYVT